MRELMQHVVARPGVVFVVTFLAFIAVTGTMEVLRWWHRCLLCPRFTKRHRDLCPRCDDIVARRATEWAEEQHRSWWHDHGGDA